MHNLPWQIFERHAQAALGLSATKGSGNQFNDPGDGVDHSHYTETDFALIIDCKLTEKDSYRVKLSDLTNWKIKAAEMGKRFALPLRFHSRQRNDDYILLTLDDFVELLEKYREK